ncbi:tyrosine-type recombinase/integrase [Kribbella sp.]|uniref:tyrosine-type recombinase/integrase n=1 Tax=Kribbella sp. TaxID=1871183 RepID=UPI002D4CFBD9|nr:tyrosine-type recombinase/integrase [Kribbella sp.]HZX07192.1 tyrosine-type recombinase/integrase [Kribbella sp.]
MSTKQRGSVSSITRDGSKTWFWAIRLDVVGQDQRQCKRFGYPTRTAATAALDHVRELLAVAGSDDHTRRLVGDLVVTRSRRGGELPAVEEVRRRYGAGLDPAAATPTVEEWCVEWLATKRRVRPATRAAYEYRLETYFYPHLGDVPLDRLRADHVTAALDWLDARNAVVAAALAAGTRVPSDPLDRRATPRVVGPATQRLLLDALAMALNGAIKRRLIAFNAAREVDPPEAERHAARVWSPDQVAAFLGHAETTGDELLPLWRLVVLRGLRRGEVTGLRWDDLDLDARTLRVERTLTATGPRGAVTGPPKTASSRRTVSLSPGDVAALAAHRSAQLRARLAAGAAYDAGPGGGWVFARADGSPTPPYAVNRRFTALAVAAGVPVIRVHDGRHTAATLGLEGGLATRLVSDQLGHSKTAITQDTYQHVRRARLDAAAETVDDLVFGTRAERTTANEPPLD